MPNAYQLENQGLIDEGPANVPIDACADATATGGSISIMSKTELGGCEWH